LYLFALIFNSFSPASLIKESLKAIPSLAISKSFLAISSAILLLFVDLEFTVSLGGLILAVTSFNCLFSFT
jgi:hypothetical protein